MSFPLSKRIAAFSVFLFLADFLIASRVSMYVSAHQDDWQLFMGVNAYNDIVASSDSTRVVFVYCTAGDFRDSSNQFANSKPAFYLAREQGAKNSVRLAADFNKQHFEWKQDTVIIKQHRIIRAVYGFVTSYFLRLPDGGMEGERITSLEHFRLKHFQDNYSVDSLTHYKGWIDLEETCRQIVANEAKGAQEIYLSLFDTATVYNPNDHSDHVESALLFLEGPKDIPSEAMMQHGVIKLFEGYNSGKESRAFNLSGEEMVKESGLFAAYNLAMMDNGYPSIWNKDYLRFCSGNHFRFLQPQAAGLLTADKVLLTALLLVAALTLVLALNLFKRDNI